MADSKAKPTPSLDAMLKQDRQKRGKKRELEQLADKIFGNKRSRTPAGTGRTQPPTLGASLASRMGVSKRPASLPRTTSAPSRASALSRTTAHLSRPVAQSNARQPVAEDLYVTDTIGASADDIALDYGDVAPHSNEISIRGAASSGPHIVIAQNFAPGTTAADIESVMQDVGGDLTECRLLASNPTVIAEMHFVERSGAETVIQTFNNKKADGRTLHVYWKAPAATASKSNARNGGRKPAAAPQVKAAPEPVIADDDIAMEIDENAAAREEQNRLREDRHTAPTGPAGGARRDREYAGDDYYRPPRGPTGGRGNGEFRGNGYGRGDGYGRGSSGGRFRQEGRLYSDDQGQRRQQGWR